MLPNLIRNIVGFSYCSQIELLNFVVLELLSSVFSWNHSYYLRTSWRFVHIHIHIPITFTIDILPSIDPRYSEFQSCEIDLILSEKRHPNK